MINYIVCFAIFLLSLYSIATSKNLLKKIISLAIFQSSVLLFFITMAKVSDAGAPILKCLDYNNCPNIYSNPLPHVLMLTAIVVGVAGLAVGIALIIRIDKSYGTIEEDEIKIIDNI
jgi:multicomponent Na+:H+ antiporter subunit C